MRSSHYLFLLLVVLFMNAGLSFFHAHLAKKDAEELRALVTFKDKGARYTYDDGVRDRAERDSRDADLQSQIDELCKKCEAHHE